VEDFGVPESNVSVVGMGHRPRVVPPDTRRFETPRFLFVGVDWRRKNGAAVLKAFSQVRLSFPDATLDIVGEHPQLSQPGVTGHGFLPRENATAQQLLDRLFANATAFVLPSLFDPSPIAYLEAASAGLPVIVTTCGGAGELLRDAAVAVNPYDGDALVAAMLHVAEPDVAQRMGTQALARSKEATWRAVSGRIADNLFGTA
jgi:glycosyltransferase involved in cell wall biosynthesis